MCGIAGIFHLPMAKPVDAARVRAMADALAHRGPDGSGVWTAPGVGLGHRRLAIIDLATGDQPMATAEGDLVVVFNGEIYNFKRLRVDLEADGAQFRTGSDTEVILHAWRKWGPACVEHFDGMFAFALHDRREGTLFLARDRLGVKPLHYTQLADGTLLFASELKGLTAHPLFRRTPEISAIEDYMAYGYVPDDNCLLAGVRKLPAGCTLLVRRGRPLPEPQRYWQPNFADHAKGSRAELEEELLSLMRDAVRSRMVADVPLGAFLSGGVDSASVVALMAEASPRAVMTCSIGFDRPELDETRHAALVAERFATDHQARTVSPDDFVAIDRLVEAFDEPFADASALPTLRVCELARERVKVALSGDGADEAMAGYRRHAFFLGEARARALLPPAIRQPLFGTLGRVWPKLDWAPRPLRFKSTLRSLGMSDAEGYADAVSVTGAELRSRLFSDDARRALDGYRAEDRYVRAMAAAPARHALDRAQYADLMLWLPGDILTKVDRTSMASGLEAREPLLDHRLIEFAARLPVSMRVRRGEGKWLMKRAMRRYLPDSILHRRKMGFVTPVSAWFRGALAEEARSIATGSALAETGLFDMKRLAELVEQHQSGRWDHGRTLWQLLMLDRSLTRMFGIGR